MRDYVAVARQVATDEVIRAIGTATTLCRYSAHPLPSSLAGGSWLHLVSPLSLGRTEFTAASTSLTEGVGLDAL